MADRLYYKITLRRPNGDLAKFRFAHVWDGEAARWDGYAISDSTPAVPDVRVTEAGDTRVTESGDRRTLE